MHLGALDELHLVGFWSQCDPGQKYHRWSLARRQDDAEMLHDPHQKRENARAGKSIAQTTTSAQAKGHEVLVLEALAI